ncbi:hypothetical protein [Halomonas sp. N3-2A]|uniref:hypothetical protein n=1 Tax=Halomonas sp. N3-2A TaxID=2014541 RepID=UPI000B5B147F|nr:hypothetical protein [Halomonas sp. N3-2A]ASK21207.1 hypothetical protein CEK60_18720 [Halomonas sp. N3-2A]
MLIVTSPSALLINGDPDTSIAQVLIEAAKDGHKVGIVSNNAKPSWFDELFAETGVIFKQELGRQNGGIVKRTAEKLKIAPQDVLVLVGSQADIAMGKNGKAVMIAAGWLNDPRVAELGIQVSCANSFKETLRLTFEWDGKWWFHGEGSSYSVHAFSDLSTFGKDFDQKQFRSHLTNTIKQGGPRLNALLAMVARSLLTQGVDSFPKLFWGVFPSSASDNSDSEVLSDFTHRLRTTVSTVRMARKGEPLFIRHKPSTKRSTAGSGINRLDPTEQVETIHLNPKYRCNLIGRNVIVVDDCTTHGVSFGVAAALLRKAGANSVTCIALGKFGRSLRDYQIDITSDPFQPLNIAGDAVLKGNSFLDGQENASAQEALKGLLG